MELHLRFQHSFNVLFKVQYSSHPNILFGVILYDTISYKDVRNHITRTGYPQSQLYNFGIYLCPL